MKITILSLSASSDSIGRVSAKAMRAVLEGSGHDTSFIDIRDLPPIWVSSDSLESLPKEYKEAGLELEKAEGVILAMPVYCYTAGSPAKAATEVFRNTLENMPVGIMAAAGSLRSHLAVGDLMISMMFEQGTICFPKTVMTNSDDLSEGVVSQELDARISDFAADFVKFCSSLQSYRLAKI